MTASDSVETVPGVTLKAQVTPELAAILTPEALTFLAALHREFNDHRVQLLEKRVARQAELDAGARYDFSPKTREIRESAWTVAPIPPDLQDRRVEITGPVDRKMIINALNSGARVFMADFEDANSPTWENCVQGQANLYDAVRREISFTNPDGKEYRLNEKVATLLWNTNLRQPLRLRLVLLPQRERTGPARQWTVLLSAQDGKPSGGASLERRLRARAGACRPAQRGHPRDSAD
jgi:malate synthase